MFIVLWIFITIYTFFVSLDVDKNIQEGHYGKVFVIFGMWFFLCLYLMFSFFYEKWKADK